MYIDAPSVPESTDGTVADNTTSPVIDETPTNSTEPVDDPGTDAPANDTTPEPTPSEPTEPTEPEEPAEEVPLEPGVLIPTSSDGQFKGEIEFGLEDAEFGFSWPSEE